MSSALATSDAEDSSSFTLFSVTACQAVTLPIGMSKPKLQSPSLPNISAITPTYLKLVSFISQACALVSVAQFSISKFEIEEMECFRGLARDFI